MISTFYGGGSGISQKAVCTFVTKGKYYVKKSIKEPSFIYLKRGKNWIYSVNALLKLFYSKPKMKSVQVSIHIAILWPDKVSQKISEMHSFTKSEWSWLYHNKFLGSKNSVYCKMHIIQR